MTNACRVGADYAPIRTVRTLPLTSFTSHGHSPRAALRLQNFRHTVFDRAARAAGLDGLTPHSLRHTAASLAITSGADVKVVQQMLGHASATMTLDLCGHLYGDRLDEVADRMDALRTARGPSADFLRTEPQLIIFPELDRSAAGQQIRDLQSVGPVGLEPTTYGLKVRSSAY